MTKSVKTVLELAALTADAIPKSSSHFGKMHASIARINALGFVTTVVNVGVKNDKIWRRGYLHGFIPRDAKDRILQALNKEDGVIALSCPWQSCHHGFDTSITIEMIKGKTEMEPCGRAWTTEHWTHHWINVVPEVRVETGEDEDYDLSCYETSEQEEAIYHDAASLQVIDTVWGRPTYVFEVTERILRDLNIAGNVK
jgi:hypothetical protein